MKKRTTEYTCDNTICKNVLVLKNEDFPYNEGWVELKAFEMGLPQHSTHRINDNFVDVLENDKEFCSVQCAKTFIESKFLISGFSSGNVKRVENKEVGEKKKSFIRRPTFFN